MLPGGDVGDMDGGAEGVQHLHLLQHVLPAGGADDEQLPALRQEETLCFILKPKAQCRFPFQQIHPKLWLEDHENHASRAHFTRVCVGW